MANWFRVDSSMVDHPRTLALAAALNEPMAGWYVIRLWSWVARYAPTGRFSGALVPHVETALGWRGVAGRLAEALIEAGWLEEASGGALLAHDWLEYQAVVAERARKKADNNRYKKNRNAIHSVIDGASDQPRNTRT